MGIALVGGLAVGLAVPSVFSPGAGHRDDDCTSDVVLIAARESGVDQVSNDDLGQPGQIFRDTLLRRIYASGRAMRVRPVVYPAAPVFFDGDIASSLDLGAAQLRTGGLDAHYASVRTGLIAVRRAVVDVADQMERCGRSQRIVLFGFSQGAQVMGDLLPSLPARARAHLGGAALFADPQFNPGEDPGVVRGDFDPKRSGLFGARPVMPVELSGKVLSYCRSKDVACQGVRLGGGPAPEYCPLPVNLQPDTGPPLDGYFDFDCRPESANVHRQYLFPALQAGNEVANRLELFGDRMSLPAPPVPGTALDTVFLIDASASMASYAERARTAIADIVDGLVAAGGDYRFGVASFRDRGEAYVSRVDVGFTGDVAVLRSGLANVTNRGGEDFREAVHSGLMTAISFPWRPGAKRAVVLIGDAPPKDPEPETNLTAAKVLAAAHGASVVVYSVIAGNDNLARGALTPLAEATGGRAFPITSLDDLTPSVTAALTDASKAPVAQFNGGGYSGVAGAPVRLYGLASFDVDGDIVAYEWDFDGDGTFEVSTTEPVVDRVFAVGTHAAALRVTDNDGRTATAATTVEVDAAERLAPGAPSGLVATRMGPKLTLRWAAPAANGSPIRYYLLRDAVLGGPIALAAGNATELELDTLASGDAVAFDVTAFDERGPGAPSSTASVSPG